MSDLSRTRETAEPLTVLSPSLRKFELNLAFSYTNLLREKGGGEIEGKPLTTTA